MKTDRLALVALCLGMWGCSDGGSDVDPGTAGASSSAGSSSASAGGSTGGASTGGASAGGASAIAGASGTDMGSCPLWPQARLMPIIGAFFYGPNPGPCSYHSNLTSSPATVTYGYQAGQVQTEQQTTDGILTPTYSKVYTTDAEGRLVSSTSVNEAETFEWGTDFLLYTVTRPDRPTQQVRYALNARGYPVSAIMTIADQPSQFVTYLYENCRLVERTIAIENGTVYGHIAYTYDSAGRVAARLDESGVGDTFDYSCW